MANTVTNKKLLAEHSALKNVLLYSVHLDSFKLIYTPKLRERQKSLSVSIKKFMSANSGSFVAIVGPHNDMLEKKFEKDPQVTFSDTPRVEIRHYFSLRCWNDYTSHRSICGRKTVVATKGGRKSFLWPWSLIVKVCSRVFRV